MHALHPSANSQPQHGASWVSLGMEQRTKNRNWLVRLQTQAPSTARVRYVSSAAFNSETRGRAGHRVALSVFESRAGFELGFPICQRTGSVNSKEAREPPEKQRPSLRSGVQGVYGYIEWGQRWKNGPPDPSVTVRKAGRRLGEGGQHSSSEDGPRVGDPASRYVLRLREPSAAGGSPQRHTTVSEPGRTDGTEI